jgi:hypothetical protein
MWSLLIAALLGALAGLGLFVVRAGFAGRAILHTGVAPRLGVPVDHLLLRGVLAAVGGVSMLLLTRWPVVGAATAALGAWIPSGQALSRRTQKEIAKVEALATWTEQLRDTLGAASGLQSALVATSTLAPSEIAPAVEHLAARLEYQRTADALRCFAADVEHPVADFVVAALLVAAEHEARDLSGLLGQLAATAREEARMRTRVWVGRARTRTSMRIIAGVIPAMVGAVMLLDRHYLDPYNSASGQAALFAVLAVFAAALLGMERMGRIRLPQRFLARPTPDVSRP